MYHKKVFLCFIFLSMTLLCSSQNPNGKNDFWKNVRFGGGIGLGFTNGGFNGSISPSSIYEFNDKFASGLSLNLNYAKFNDDKLLAYGGSVLSLYNPLPYLQFSAEFEQLRINRTFDTGFGTLEKNYWSPALFLGIGYSNSNVTFGIRYDVLYDDTQSIYANAWMPFVRVYF